MSTRIIQGFFAGGRPRFGSVMQAKGTGQPYQVDPTQLDLARGGGRPLPDAVRGKMEAALGADFSAVRVHVGPQADRIGAVAFTLGTDIYFAPGRYQPDTPQGQQLLGHELAHVVQQRQGRVRAPTAGGIAVVQDRALEAEADRLGQRAAMLPVQAKPARGRAVQLKSACAGVIQRVPCAICGWSQVPYTDSTGENIYNGHAPSCMYYVREYETQADRAINNQNPHRLRQRSHSLRRLDQVQVPWMAPNGQQFVSPQGQPLYLTRDTLTRVHGHNNINTNGGPVMHDRGTVW